MLLPPVCIDPAWIGTSTPIPQPHQNWSQHARLLPFLEQQVAYNQINWDFGARWRTAIPCIPISTRADAAAAPTASPR